MKINSVLGPMDTKDMGLTLMHEHIINIEWNFARAFPDFYDREKTVQMFCAEMETLKAYGVTTFVDATPITLGRDVQLMRECSERSGVNILAGTGIYWQEHPFFFIHLDEQVLADLMIREIEHGMEGTDSKPAFIKCASQAVLGVSDNNRKMLRAAAIASKATGLPILIHTDPGVPLGREQKQVFEETEIAPEKLYFCHVFSVGDDAYVADMMADGSYVGCDQVSYAGVWGMADLERMAEMTEPILRDDEKRKKLFLSCDAALRSDFGMSLSPYLRDPANNPMIPADGRKKPLFEGLLPLLRQRGVAEEHLREVLEINPRRFFGENI